MYTYITSVMHCLSPPGPLVPVELATTGRHKTDTHLHHTAKNTPADFSTTKLNGVFRLESAGPRRHCLSVAGIFRKRAHNCLSSFQGRQQMQRLSSPARHNHRAGILCTQSQNAESHQHYLTFSKSG